MATHVYYRSYQFESNETDRNKLILLGREQYKRDLANGKEDSRFLKDGLFRDQAEHQPKPKNLWEQFKADVHYAVTGKR